MWSRSLLAVGLVIGVWAQSASAAYKAVHGVNAAAYQNFINDVTRTHFRPTVISVHNAGGGPLFSAVAVADNFPWVARHGLSPEDYQKAFNEWGGKGYRLVSVAGYNDHGVRYAALWVKDNDNRPWVARHGMTAAEYQAFFNEQTAKGLRPEVVSGYSAGGAHYAAIFRRSDGHPFVARHGVTAAEYQKVISDYSPKGYRPIAIDGFEDGGQTRFNIVMAQGGNVEWIARHNLTAADYQQEFNKNGANGYEPALVSGYAVGHDSRYAGVWVRSTDLPMTGTAVPSLAAFDQAMIKFMKDRGIRAGTLAVSHNGKLVLSRGYGYATRDSSRQVAPDDPFRIASVVKPLTEAAVRKLIRDGKLTADTKVFPLLGITPPAGQTADKRLNDITVQHLLDHKGGWDRTKGPVFDPMFQSAMIAKALGISGPPSANDIIKYMVGQPLQYTPGGAPAKGGDNYSNFGYCVLGRVIEKVSGQSYIAYLQQNILSPLGIHSIQVGHTLTTGRNPHEPVYIDTGTGTNIVTGKGTVAAPDGTFYIEAMDSHGGLISSAPDLIKFLNAYQIDGNPKAAGADGWFFGSLPGTWTLARQRADGVNIVALFNQRTNPAGLKNEDIKDMLDAAAAGIKKWP